MSYHHDMIYDDTLGVCVRESRSSDGFRRLPEKERPEEGRDKVAESSRLALACYENMMNIKRNSCVCGRVKPSSRKKDQELSHTFVI